MDYKLSKLEALESEDVERGKRLEIVEKYIMGTPLIDQSSLFKKESYENSFKRGPIIELLKNKNLHNDAIDPYLKISKNYILEFLNNFNLTGIEKEYALILKKKFFNNIITLDEFDIEEMNDIELEDDADINNEGIISFDSELEEDDEDEDDESLEVENECATMLSEKVSTPPLNAKPEEENKNEEKTTKENKETVSKLSNISKNSKKSLGSSKSQNNNMPLPSQNNEEVRMEVKDDKIKKKNQEITMKQNNLLQRDKDSKNHDRFLSNSNITERRDNKKRDMTSNQILSIVNPRMVTTNSLLRNIEQRSMLNSSIIEKNKEDADCLIEGETRDMTKKNIRKAIELLQEGLNDEFGLKDKLTIADRKVMIMQFMREKNLYFNFEYFDVKENNKNLFPESLIIDISNKIIQIKKRNKQLTGDLGAIGIQAIVFLIEKTACYFNIEEFDGLSKSINFDNLDSELQPTKQYINSLVPTDVTDNPVFGLGMFLFKKYGQKKMGLNF